MKLPKETASARQGHGRWYADACGAAFAMEVIGERWSLLVVRELMFGGCRFSGLRARLPGLSAKVLTERLSSLEAAGVVARRRLPAPISAWVYELTDWGYAAEPLLQELGRWAAMSSQHDPTLPLSPVSFMLSLRTMFDSDKAGKWQTRIGFRFPDVTFVAELMGGGLSIARTEPDSCSAIFVVPGAEALAAMFYGGVAATQAGATIEGDVAAAERFIAFFELPEKLV